MSQKNPIAAASLAVLAISEIKASVEAFDRGDVNVFDALSGIVVAINGYQTASQREAA